MGEQLVLVEVLVGQQGLLISPPYINSSQRVGLHPGGLAKFHQSDQHDALIIPSSLIRLHHSTPLQGDSPAWASVTQVGAATHC